MQLPSVDRTQAARPSGVDPAVAAATRVIPVAPVNPSATADLGSTELTSPSPGVVNLVNPNAQAGQSGSQSKDVYSGLPDPTRSSASQPANSKDWTIHHSKAEKTQDPPQKPIYQVLIENLKTVWAASANAIQTHPISDQLGNQLGLATQAQFTQAPSAKVEQALTYQPSKIKKTEGA